MKDTLKIRSQYKKKRNAMPDALASQLSERMSEIVLGWEVYQHAKTVFFYYPLGKEVSLLPVIQDALRKGKCVAFPKTTGDHMAFYEVTDLQELKEGSFHVMEPVSKGRAPVCQKPEICFVPGIVFDRSGARFGYGKGYYDRYFEKKDAVKLVGCAYEEQVAKSLLPIHTWDVKMDYLLTEHGIFVPEREKVKRNV